MSRARVCVCVCVCVQTQRRMREPRHIKPSGHQRTKSLPSQLLLFFLYFAQRRSTFLHDTMSLRIDTFYLPTTSLSVFFVSQLSLRFLPLKHESGDEHLQGYIIFSCLDCIELAIHRRLTNRANRQGTRDGRDGIKTGRRDAVTLDVRLHPTIRETHARSSPTACVHRTRLSFLSHELQCGLFVEVNGNYSKRTEISDKKLL